MMNYSIRCTRAQSTYRLQSQGKGGEGGRERKAPRHHSNTHYPYRTPILVDDIDITGVSSWLSSPNDTHRHAHACAPPPPTLPLPSHTYSIHPPHPSIHSSISTSHDSLPPTRPSHASSASGCPAQHSTAQHSTAQRSASVPGGCLYPFRGGWREGRENERMRGSPSLTAPTVESSEAQSSPPCSRGRVHEA